MNENQIKKKIKKLKKSIDEKDLFHEFCLIFPFNEDLVVELVNDIEKSGLINYLTRYNGKILDGRHRWYACKILGILPQAVDVGLEVDPIRYVKSQNLKRRDLTAWQRITIALKLDGWKPKTEGEKVNAIKELKHNRWIGVEARSIPETVKKVKRILEIAMTESKMKEAIDKLDKGKISIDTAYRKAKKPEKKIEDIEKEKEPLERELLRKLRKKYSELLNIYNYVKERCIELGVWDKIYEIEEPKKSSEPTVEELRKAELRF